MKNKLLLSVAASALLITSAFAATEVGKGSLTIASGGGVSTIEYNEKFGDVASLDLTDMNYTAEIKGSGSVSDALIRINIADTNLSATGVDLDALFGNQRIMNVDTNNTIAGYDRTIDDADGKWILFAGDATTSVVTGKEYVMRSNDSNQTSGVTYGFITGGDTINLDVWSTSGSEELRDTTTVTSTTTLVPQFSTSCIAKFDGLINIESLQDSFVNTAHDNASNGELTDGLSQWDTLVFTVNNNNAGLALDGNASAITMQTRNSDGTTLNVDNNFSDVAIWNSQVVAVQQNGTSNIYPLAHDIVNLTTNAALNDGTQIAAGAGVIHYTTDGNLTFILPNTTIPSGTTTYYVGLGHTAGVAGIKPVNFVNARLALEAGLDDLGTNLDNNNTIYPAGDTPRGAGLDAGKWMNHAYIAQIAGATENPGVVTSKFFIVNRSCAVATPIYKLIQDGKVATIPGSSIAIDSQAKVRMADLIASPEAVAAGFTGTQFAVEIMLPGIAENFYIYAQALTAGGATKDLPVYNTSERD